ncbi:MAG: hypothetical protein PHO10_03700 [Gemmiger sp.]|nr:hypothetical protein [Gemmiger sp.]
MNGFLQPNLRRILRFCVLLCCLCSLLALPAAADAGDYDEIENYVITVEPQQDGSADITYAVDWSVIGGSGSDYLSWVKIGLPNSHAENLEILTPDTVAQIDYLEDGGSYARLVFQKRYYAPAVAAKKGAESKVHFSFKVHQSHLFSLNEDNTASFEFTPGWFDDLCVTHMQIRWKNYEGFVADNTATDGEYLTWDFGPLAHGEAGTARVTVPVTTAQTYDQSLSVTSEDWSPSGTTTTGTDAEDEGFVIIVFVLVLIIAIALMNTARVPSWQSGLGEDRPPDYLFYSNGAHIIRLARGAPPPPGHHPVPPPPGASAFKAGGGGTRGGGAGRHGGGGGGCACASSCACACACAGGGRAGCSVKNFYRVKLPQPPQKKDGE